MSKQGAFGGRVRFAPGAGRWLRQIHWPEPRQQATIAVFLLPSGLVALFAFNAGGFFPGPPAFVAALLAGVLALHAMFARSPFMGFGRRFRVTLACLSGFALLTLASTDWSGAPGPATLRFDLALLYLLVAAVTGMLGRTQQRLRLLLMSLAGVCVGICGLALFTRLLSDVLPIDAVQPGGRLSYPVSYSNALGVLCVIGILLCTHIASEPKPRQLLRLCAAASVPPLACALVLTFSRGALLVGALGLAVYVLSVRSRSLAATCLSLVPGTAVAVISTAQAHLITGPRWASHEAIAEGHELCLIVVGCMAVTAGVQQWLSVRTPSFFQPLSGLRVSSRRLHLDRALLALVVVGALVAGSVGVSHEASKLGGRSVPSNLTRLSDPAIGGRLDVWKVAWEQFQSTPLLGSGAGTFANVWTTRRPNAAYVQNAHSLYLEVLAELGVVGLALLLVAILAPLIRAARAMRGPDRPTYAVTFSVLLVLALHTGIDWDWELPVLTVIYFALAGAVLALPAPGTASGQIRTQRRVTLERLAVAATCLALGVVPALVWFSERQLSTSITALEAGSCPDAVAAAHDSISALSIESEPYEVIAYCASRTRTFRAALDAADTAARLDPGNWIYAYDVALLRGSLGLPSGRALARAQSLNPRASQIDLVSRLFRRDSGAAWRRSCQERLRVGGLLL